MFIPIADFWMNGWGQGAPEVPNVRATATVSQRMVGSATVSNSARTERSTQRQAGGAGTSNRTLGGQ